MLQVAPRLTKDRSLLISNICDRWRHFLLRIHTGAEIKDGRLETPWIPTFVKMIQLDVQPFITKTVRKIVFPCRPPNAK